MEGEDRQSSLPSSLIPHLYSGPQLTRDAGGTFRAPPERSSPVASGVPMRPPSPPTTMAPVMTTSPAFVQGRSIYSPYGPIDPDMHSRSMGIAAPENLQLPGVRRAADNQAMPSGGQRPAGDRGIQQPRMDRGRIGDISTKWGYAAKAEHGDAYSTYVRSAIYF